MKIIPVIEGPLPVPTTNREQVKTDVREFGYGIVLDALTQLEVQRLKLQLSAEIEKDEKVGNIKESYTDRDSVNRRIHILMERHECFLALVEHPIAMEMAESMLGPSYLNEPFLLHELSANVTRPGSRDMGLHADTDFIIPYCDIPLFTRIIWAVDDFDEEVGATRVVPKSHHFGHFIEKDGSVHYESVPVEAPAGSAIIYDGRLYHGTGVNRSKDRERAAIISGYVPPWIQPMTSYPMVLNPKVLKGASERCRQLLGYGTVNMGFDYPWKYARENVAALAIGQKRTIEEMRREVRKN